MRRPTALAAVLLALAMPLPAVAADPAPPVAAAPQRDPLAERVDEAEVLIASGQPAKAVAVLDEVIAQETRIHVAEKRRIYAARSLAETLTYMTMAAADSRNAVALDDTWSRALFLKGFALVDLKRYEEARALFEQAIEKSPLNSRYLGELGEIYKGRREWDTAFKVFSRASAAAELSPDDVKSSEQRRAWRGMGFALIELGRFDEAEKMFQQCLALEPGDAGARNELSYIAQLRARAAAPPPTS